MASRSLGQRPGVRTIQLFLRPEKQRIPDSYYRQPKRIGRKSASGKMQAYENYKIFPIARWVVR